ncbi:Transcriptional regulator containing PAS, AAA-type ATPase, and DNA-binding Fis domains [Anaerosphaera aminiphila DSM 21120]|uniref:Transcriptional regulator containing PAS, AAA-type ATPase, and DNA-binding Fis domains n=1 Tax=Anaerosphaera aminiphila DSM 21120 TaxID=1120995 RepID=A0A1M5PMX4_9FIRM|nr:sigma 54-interacting transcriptional regulator [Anaerosphaera aminiphila]SHH03081.1 Transcriptional regulator containing PAS, AAA-type ATPase, and DNA-binding Fis domains [Anaerosphaera aminiphila DSM 21120]
MEKILFELKPFLDTLVSSFSAVLNLEFTIINSKPISRISGTGVYESALNQKEWKNTYTDYVITTKERLIVIEPEKTYPKIIDKVSESYYSIILEPIKINDDVLGVLVIASFDEVQQKFLISNQDKLVKYLKNISELITSKILESKLRKEIFESNENLKEIINYVNEGILLFNKGTIVTNSIAESILCSNKVNIYNNLIVKIKQKIDESLEHRSDMESKIIEEYNDIYFMLFLELKFLGENKVLVLINTLEKIQTQNFSNSQQNNTFETIITQDEKMLDLKNKINTFSNNDSNVLIQGETGTGKELFARAVHDSSYRNKKPFVAINCASIPESLLESELFGYHSGAFTGASKTGKVGKIVLANNGTLFLDEIGDMPLYLQAKLLRVLNDSYVEPIGSEKPIKVNIRIISATNKNLTAMVENNEFRSDLFFRLNVIPMYIPPLRERKKDIQLLASYFIKKYNTKFNKNVRGIDIDTLEILDNYSWPGNVRELENTIEYAMNFKEKGNIFPEDLPKRISEDKTLRKNTFKAKNTYTYNNELTLKTNMNLYEKFVIQEQLDKYPKPLSNKNLMTLCNNFNISPATLYRKLK